MAYTPTPEPPWPPAEPIEPPEPVEPDPNIEPPRTEGPGPIPDWIKVKADAGEYT